MRIGDGGVPLRHIAAGLIAMYQVGVVVVDRKGNVAMITTAIGPETAGAPFQQVDQLPLPVAHAVLHPQKACQDQGLPSIVVPV